jgi:tripartite ATP-independent transporter DctM subunit
MSPELAYKMTSPTGSGRIARWSIAGEVVLARAIEVVVVMLLCAEFATIFLGVAARYALHSPIVWADELASILFIWLSMLGAVIAFRQSEHMRMSALVDKLAPGPRAFVALLATTTALSFLVFLLPAGVEGAIDEHDMLTLALEIPNSWRAAALPVGAALMIVFGLLQLARFEHRRLTAMAVVSTIVVIALAALLKPVFADLGHLNLLIFFVGVVAVAVFAGVPIAFAFGVATYAYVALATQSPATVIASRINEGMSHLILLAVPLFVFLGKLIEMTGMARVMVEFLASLLGHVRGGLSYVLVGAMYLVSGISGSKAADMAAVTPVLFPEMKKRGAKPGDLVALLSATGAQTETVPPSIVLITIGSVTSVSIAALFTGGLLPALVCGLTLCLLIGYRYRREDRSQLQRPNWATIRRTFIAAAPAIALPFIIRYAVVEGVATTTEVSTIAIVYSLIIGLAVHRHFDWSRLMPMMIETASLSGAILLIIGAATAMGWGLTQSGFSRDVAAFMTHLPGGAATFMVASVVIFIVLGSVLEGIPAIVLFGPLLFPIARQLGVHEVHYSMVVILSMGLGLFSPPFGVGYYAACAIAGTNPNEGMRAIWTYMFALFCGIVIVATIPWISIGFL